MSEIFPATLEPEVIAQLHSAHASGNAFDLYDALADNGLETEEVYTNGEDVAWLKNYVLFLLCCFA